MFCFGKKSKLKQSKRALLLTSGHQYPILNVRPTLSIVGSISWWCGDVGDHEKPFPGLPLNHLQSPNKPTWEFPKRITEFLKFQSCIKMSEGFWLTGPARLHPWTWQLPVFDPWTKWDRSSFQKDVWSVGFCWYSEFSERVVPSW